MAIASGVPQGPIWPPLLFDLFVRNVPKRVKNAKCLFYADDLTLIRQIREKEKEKVKAELEEDLQRLNDFGEEWMLRFEATKSQSVTISNKHGKNVYQSDISMGNSIVKEKEILEVLGFQIDNKGNWGKHVETTAKEAKKRLGAIKRIKQYLDDKSYIRMYKAFVRSKLEYGNLVYWGAAETHLGKLDAVHNSAISVLKKPSGIPSLESRRRAAALGLTCKLLDGEGRGEMQSLKPQFCSNNRQTLRRSKRINQKSHKFQIESVTKAKSLNTFKRTFRGRIPDIWNNLGNNFLYEDKISKFQDKRKSLQKSVMSENRENAK